MRQRDRFFIIMAVTVVAAAAITVALGTILSYTGDGIQGPEFALILPILMIASVVIWIISRSGK